MNILGIDTSFLSDTAIGIYISEDEQLELSLRAPLSQSEKLFFSINSALQLINKDISNIDFFAVGIGPGSFTGIRIGIAAAQSLAWAQNKKLIGISSLELLALSFPKELLSDDTLIVPVIDARMSRVFSAIFYNGKNISDNLDISPEDLTKLIKNSPGSHVIMLGDGLQKYGGCFQEISGKKINFLNNIRVSGLTVCRKALSLLSENPGDDFNPKKVLPLYLRKSEAEAQWESRKQ